MKYGPQNGTNSIQGYCIRCFQLVLVPNVLNQVCWSHFFGLWNKLQLLEAVQFNYEIWSTKSDQQHPRSFFSMFLVSIGPKCLESGMWDQQVPTDANRYQQMPTGTNRYQQVPTSTNKYQQVPTGTNKYQQEKNYLFCQYLPILRHFCQFSASMLTWTLLYLDYQDQRQSRSCFFDVSSYLVLVPNISNQVCWSHFLSFLEKLRVAFHRRPKNGTNTPDMRELGPI